MLRFLIEKEFKQIIRHPFIPKLIFVFPCMVMLVFPWAATFEIKDVNLSIVDSDHSTYSTRLAQKIVSSGYFRLTDVSDTYSEALQSIERHASDLVLTIGQGFERDLVREGSAKLMIAANSVNGTKSGMGSSYLSAIIRDFSDDLRREQGQMQGTGVIPVIHIAPQYRFNPHLDYKVYMAPALMVILLTLLCGFLPALSIVGEKEAGTIEQMNVTPVSKFRFILAKLIPCWLIGFVALSLSFGLAALIYNLFPAGSLLAIYCFASIFVLVVSGFGLVVSNYSATMQQAMFVMMFFLILFICKSRPIVTIF
ncbi:MAG: ABC transporter permease [Bacteroidales bacterium]|jgi:ABC-2 type transport system permease protein|nr:ABC transporter permease [Bacteroidales bacterium]